jgi:hypothetical protein
LGSASCTFAQREDFGATLGRHSAAGRAASARAWAREGRSTDLIPLVALSLARWGDATQAHLHNREPSSYV